MHGFRESTARTATCVGDGSPLRSSASRVWVAELEPPADIAGEAMAAAGRVTGLPGKVLLAGGFSNEVVHRLLTAALPAEARSTLRSRFEWYCCHGAFFHNDAHYADVMFGAWCVQGPERELVFPRLSVRVPARRGQLVVFDPFEPHAVLRPGHQTYEKEHYQSSAVSVFVGFELELSNHVRSLFGIGAPAPGEPELSSRVRVNAQTGSTSVA